MTEFNINDEWVMSRISKESNSFKNWIEGIISTVEKSIEDVPEAQKDFELQKKELPDLVNIEEKLQKVQAKLDGLGALGTHLSKIGSNIQSLVTKKVSKSLQESKLADLDLNIDFLTGKRKTLSEALYDVAKERKIQFEGILYLIKSLPDLESFLYSTSAGKLYRDHTEHQLRVAVLGDFLLEQDLGIGSLVKHISDLTEIDNTQLKDEIWWVMGLLHDIGYPLEKMTRSINFSLLNQILKCYPMLDIDVVPFEVNLSKENKQQKEYLKFLEEGLTKDAIKLVRAGAGYDLESFPIPEIKHFVSNDIGHSEYNYRSTVNLDHGVIGALALLKSLGSPEELKENRDEYESYIRAAQAIAIHNFKDKLSDFTFEKNPLAFLLVMIDEMQEWGRPIPLQIRDTYFTTELRKITLLDEISLQIEGVEWLMIYKKKQAKELTNFQFQFFCDSKKKAFDRLIRGKEFPETRIVIQDVEPAESSSQIKGLLESETLGNLLAKSIIEESVKHTDKEILSKKKEEVMSQKEKERSLSFEDLVPIEKSSKEKLLAEFYIVI